eukprot:m.70437 g.70437  ORF g.70437 m.70437 type:complete len:120 (+) comp7878_c1_seq1:2761-3120(+)
MSAGEAGGGLCRVCAQTTAASAAMSGRYNDNDRLRDTQRQVDEVVGIMKTNMNKVIERDERLGNLEEKSENLREGSTRFESTSRRLKRKMWWKNIKFMLILAAVIIVLIIIIVLIAHPW